MLARRNVMQRHGQQGRGSGQVRLGAWAGAVVALGLALSLWCQVGCQRSLDGAPCPCVDSGAWVCCRPANVCMPAGAGCPSVVEAGLPPGTDAMSDAPADRRGDRPIKDAAPDTRDAAGDGAAGRDAPPGPRDASMSDGSAAGHDGAAHADAGHDAGSDAPGTPPVDQSPLPEVCISDGWCWTHPVPTGETIARVWAPGRDDIWVMGAGGGLLRWNGSAWSSLPPPPTPSIAAIWGSAANDVWLGGDEGMWHWDGQKYAMVPPSSAPGSRGVYAFWGTSARDIWAVGSWLWHWDGKVWAAPDIPSSTVSGPLVAAWGTAANNVYAASYATWTTSTSLIHWDGQTWLPVASLGGPYIAGTGPADILISSPNQIWRWDGSASSPVAIAPPLALVQGGPALVGAMDDMFRLSWWDGTSWSSPTPPAPAGLGALWADGRTNVWGGGASGTVASWDGAAWTRRLPRPTVATDTIRGFAGTAADDVWAVADSAVLHFDGVKWSVALPATSAGGGIRDVWASARDDAWVLGADNLIHRWTVKGWQTQQIPLRTTGSNDLIAISGTADDDVFIVRGGDTVVHWDGNVWAALSSDRAPLTDVWADARGDAWVAGNGLAHWQNGYLYSQTVAGPGTVSLITGGGVDDVWIAMGHATYRYDGSRWSPITDFDGDVLAVASRNGDVWMVAKAANGRSRLQHQYGQAMTGADRPLDLRSAWIAPDGTAWLGGGAGTILRRRP